MDSIGVTRFPQLMQLCTLLAGATFILVFPASVIFELYGSFGYFQGTATFSLLRNIVLVVAGIFFLLNLIINLNHWLRLSSVWLYAILILYISAVVLLNFDEYGDAKNENVSAAEFHFSIVSNYLVYCLLGTHLLFLKQSRFLILISTVVAAVVLIQFIDFDTFRINIAEYVDGANTGNYQFIGDALGISFLMILALFSNPLLKVAVIVCGSAILFLVGSRTSFAFFMLTAVLYYFLNTRALWLFTVVIGLFGAWVFYSDGVNLAQLEELNPRMVRIFTDYSDDNSIIGRKERDEAGWEDITNSPITGVFGGQRTIGGWNGYMHNVFSYWRQFGISPFLIVLLTYFLFLFFCLIRYPARSNFNYSASFLLGLFLVVESVVSRSFAFGYTHLFFGMLMAFHAWGKYSDSFATAGGKRARRRRKRKRHRKTRSLEN